MPRRSAKIDGLIRVECLVDEVFTGLAHPAKLNKGDREALPYEIALILIRSEACKSV